jgi:cell division septal protein FtsQ
MKVGWKILGGTAAALTLWLGGPALGRRLDFFQIRQVELVGVEHLAPRTLLAALALKPGASVFDDLSPLAGRLLKVPGVLEASVGRRLPGRLQVRIREAVPVALTPRAEGLSMVDTRGRVLPYDPARAAPDLPVAMTPDRAVAELLARMRELDPELYAEVSAAWRVQEDVIVEIDGRKIWFRPDASAEEMHAVRVVAQDLARRKRAFEELDARFAGQIIVRGARA